MAIKLYRENRVRLTFEGVASRSDEQADKVDLGVLLLWNHDLVRDARDGRLVVDGWFEFRIQRQHLLDHGVTLLFQLAPGAELARVQPLAVCAVDGLGRRRSDSATQEKKRTFVHCSSTKFQRRRDHRKKNIFQVERPIHRRTHNGCSSTRGTTNGLLNFWGKALLIIVLKKKLLFSIRDRQDHVL